MPSDEQTEPKLSVILPGYNEREALPSAVRRYLEAMDDPAIGCADAGGSEIIVVDDGSTDGMGELADEMARADARVRVIHHERNLGQVAGILSGFRQARGRIVTHNGMDLPFDPRETGRALALFDEGADVVVVQRETREAYGLLRKIVSWGNIVLVQSLFDTPFLDHNFTQFFRRTVVESIPVRSCGVSTVTLELVVRSLRKGYRVVGLSTSYHEREIGQSTVNMRRTLHTAKETVGLWRLMRRPD